MPIKFLVLGGGVFWVFGGGGGKRQLYFYGRSDFSDLCQTWEVLNGVGVDGVGVIFPFSYVFSPFFLRISLLLPEDKGKQQQFTAKMGISLRPRLHRPRAKLSDKLKFSWNVGKCHRMS